MTKGKGKNELLLLEMGFPLMMNNNLSQRIMRKPMRITREKHLNYLTRLMPFLFGAYILQCYLYLQWAPRDLALDVALFMGIGIVLVSLGFAFYDQIHTVKLHRHHLVISIDLIKYKEEILYSHIQHIKVNPSSHAFYNVTLTLRNGETHKLYYLDDVEELKQHIRNA